jgi:hypothetical protein
MKGSCFIVSRAISFGYDIPFELAGQTAITEFDFEVFNLKTTS